QFEQRSKAHLYALPQKKEWLLPAHLLKDWHTFDDSLKHVNASLDEKRSVLVYEQSETEMLKYFVVWW
ncbi:MAG: hypothetical protein R3359_02075, partial [Marinirhabdus sp.]|nr:hypothetical protein [Marinirhabdus sp.]